MSVFRIINGAAIFGSSLEAEYKYVNSYTGMCDFIEAAFNRGCDGRGMVSGRSGVWLAVLTGTSRVV
jgi:hypothetical protein